MWAVLPLQLGKIYWKIQPSAKDCIPLGQNEDDQRNLYHTDVAFRIRISQKLLVIFSNSSSVTIVLATGRVTGFRRSHFQQSVHMGCMVDAPQKRSGKAPAASSIIRRILC